MRLKLALFFTFVSTVIFGQVQTLYKFADKNGKYGFMDKTGKIRVKPTFIDVQDFSEGLSFVSKKTSKRGYKWMCIDTLGNKVFDIGEDFIEEKFSEGFAVISNFNEVWFINRKGEKQFDKTWKDHRGNFENGIAIVSDIKFDDYYYINANGQKLTNFPEGNISIFKKGFAVVFNNKYAIIDSIGNKIYDSFDAFGGFNDDLIKIKKNGKWGFIDKTGRVIIDFLYEEDRRKEFDKYLKLNTDSLDTLPKAKLRNIGFFSDGLVEFQKDSLWGFIDKKNTIVIEPKYKRVKQFSEGVAGVSLDGIKWGFIDKNSNYVIEPKFYLVSHFERGICAIRQHNRPFEIAGDFYLDTIINLNGEILNELPLHCYQGFDGDLIQYYGGFHFSGGVHYLDEHGQIVVPSK
jgi:WG containing repeat